MTETLTTFPNNGKHFVELPRPKNERWQPIRSGLLNIYLYDYEEFRYEQGHLLLRGNNGTGKSRVLALQLPFLLDGQVASHRVEPDADKAKRMEWNLLMGKHSERLGYTWIEFGRCDADGREPYFTLGCGLSATKASGLRDPWFFTTSQRVGRDLFLQTDAGHPLTRAALEDAIGEHGEVYTTATRYRQSIDEKMFKLGAQRYDASAKKWTPYTGSTSAYNENPKNERFVVYGMPIYATRDGKVIACWRNAPQNPAPGTRHPKIDAGFVYGGGNGYWIEHSDGTKMEYAHMIPGTVRSNLCPHDAALMPSKIASPNVADAWKHIRVPENQQATIKRGQFLGRVGNAGTSSGPHLHIHLQTGEPNKAGTPQKMRFRRGLSAPLDHGDPHGKWTRFAGKSITPGPVLVWPPRTRRPEYARHGFAAPGFQALFAHLADSGFMPEWIDGYSVGDRTFFNSVWRPAQTKWRAWFGKTGKEFQALANDAVNDGFAPLFVDSYRSGRTVRYAVVFAKQPVGFKMRHGLSYEQHMKLLKQFTQAGMRPVVVSVVSRAGKRRYTVLYHRRNLGAVQVKSQLTENGYQNAVNKNKAKGRHPIYVNGYVHKGKAQLTAIFAQRPGKSWQARHRLSGSAYQSTWQKMRSSGRLTHAVTAFDGAKKSHRFAAVWWR